MPRSSASRLAARARRPRRLRAFACLWAWAWLACAGQAIALDPSLPADRYTVTRWTADDGLPHSQVHDIAQAGDGYLWLTGWEGTSRFDGVAFTEVAGLRHPDGRPLASRMLWRDAEDGLLVGLDSLGLMRVAPTGEVAPACAGTTLQAVARLAAGRDGRPWVAARDGLFRLAPDGRCTQVEGGAEVAALSPLSLLAREDGSLWIGHARGLSRWHAGRIEPLGEQLGLPRGEVRALTATGDGDVWIAGDTGVWRLRAGRLSRQRPERAEALLQDGHGALWVTGTESVVLRHWRGRWERLDARHGISGYATGALFEDREGLVWFGTTHGLFRIADGPVWGFGEREGLPTDYVRSVLQTADGQAWIGHSLGLSRIRDGRPETVVLAPDQPPASVLSLARAGDGGVWAGTYNRGVLRVSAGRPAIARALLPASAPLSTAQVRALLEAPDGTLWIGTEQGLAAWRDGALDPDPLPGLPRLPVRALHLDADGALWIGQLGGLARREPGGHLVVPTTEAEYPALSAFDFLPDPDGGLWIASDRGLVLHRDGVYRLYGRAQGLPGSTVFRVLMDQAGHLWASGNHGVFRIAREALRAFRQGESARLDLQVFGREDGVPSRQANGGSAPAGWRMDDGALWFPTAAGIAVFDPARVALPPAGDVPLVIGRLQVDGIDRPAMDGHALPPGARVSIRYAGISLRHPGALRYRYRMHGLDEDWIEAGQAREVTYTNLPPGRLRFEVQVARAPADWAHPAGRADLTFDVAAPWWTRPWMVLPALLLGLLAPLGLHHALGRHQRMRQRRLEAEVARHTARLRETNRQLEDASRQREQLMERLLHQASHDPLTGLPNRRASDQQLSSALQHADLVHAPLCAALVDVDRFRHVNDRYGHHVGDRVLARVALQLQASLQRGNVFVGRTGGEEFVVVLRDTCRDDAVALLERARADVAALRLGPDHAEPIACTISAGVVARTGQEGPDQLLQRADVALYEAKRLGRNRVAAA
ncbi:diguanylate cyclase [Luteimonas kalidii]|uniref:diguanylate cyclase n=1 Tax=Luteimonas kalidii TaxID=3042025 RepID=A0ABT6JRM2_9GAMM|nr:diguanylate cyclase [Luteimonas kalidii]MDH5833336.1 diguanylate cyclase [Luteimonas kalidii]